jgi:hypothetical protein
VQEAAVSLLTEWESFYVIIGSSAAALTGLMFVVITLIAGTHNRSAGGALAAFGTPNVVHFSAALLIAAVLSAPWQVLWPIAFLLGLAGLGGVTYVFIVARRARRQTEYQPVFEDWLWHVALPFVAYAVLIIAAILLLSNTTPGMFAVGAVTVLLVFIGIHNAWDTVTYLTIELLPSRNEQRG